MDKVSIKNGLNLSLKFEKEQSILFWILELFQTPEKFSEIHEVTRSLAVQNFSFILKNSRVLDHDKESFPLEEIHDSFFNILSFSDIFDIRFLIKIVDNYLILRFSLYLNL